MEGKTVAIDSSIWLYQFQATMRDKDGNVLSNAHVLGFLRRICKLLFYGMKPVFVFDGGAPALKRATLRERRQKKTGASASHAKLAERLLAAQMRREAVKHASGPQASKTLSNGKRRADAVQPGVQFLEELDPSMPQTTPRQHDEPSPSKKKRSQDYDPYKLPEVDMDARLANATRSIAPDPRLATEEELRAFIEEMRPEDFDVTSPAFRELPTEVQYEIVGDLRLKSRQTSYTRLQQMLRSAPTPLDFSKQQIKNLKQRNSLTQQLLVTTDSIGKAHIAIPIRIASERNKQYMLIKNGGDDGGWVLGIRDDGTADKPIILDHEEDEALAQQDDSDDDMDMEEIPIPISHSAHMDIDLRDLQRSNALSAIGNRHSVKRPLPKTTSQAPLFEFEEDDIITATAASLKNYLTEEEQMELAIQDSLEMSRYQQISSHLVSSNVASSSKTKMPDLVRSPSPISGPSGSAVSSPSQTQGSSMFPMTSRLGTALSIGNALPNTKSSSAFGAPRLLLSPPSKSLVPQESHVITEDVLSVSSSHASSSPPSLAETKETSSDNAVDILREASPTTLIVNEGPHAVEMSEPRDNSESGEDDNDMEEVQIGSQSRYLNLLSNFSHSPSPFRFETSIERPLTPPIVFHSTSITQTPSHSPSPDIDTTPSKLLTLADDSRPASPTGEHWDAAQEIDVDAEEGEFARFISQVKGRNLEDVRREIDDEIESLNKQRKAAQRDSEDITHQMVSQIMTMLRLFGIPYITAPMEAEAQCATLVSLGLVDGIITDDSDVFLFGGMRVYKNMFNQSKTVECFLLSDLSRELGLDRSTLVQLAYLLGSDYVEGIPGVGPVMAMELLKEFPGDDGLHKFKYWWNKVQSGKDKDEDNKSNFRKSFKKKFKSLFLPSEWPNTAVRDGYYHPTVDESDEPFKWGLPDLDALRMFLHQELNWGQSKVDDLLLPIIQKVNRRNQASAINRQGTLSEFVNVTGGSGTLAPRRRQAYTSKRLQDVVSEFRKKRNLATLEEDEGEEVAPPKKKQEKKKELKVSGRGRGLGRGGRGGKRKRKVQSDDDFEGDANEREEVEDASVIPARSELRPRPKPHPVGKVASVE